jgi:hypothetical protein
MDNACHLYLSKPMEQTTQSENLNVNYETLSDNDLLRQVHPL